MADVATTSDRSAKVGADRSREVVRCKRCRLNQFKTRAERCRKCGAPYQEPEPVIAIAAMPITTGPIELHDVDSATSAVMRTLRIASGHSQRKLASLMHCPRTFVSKFENKKSLPTIDTLQRFADAVNLPIDGIVTMIECVAKLGVKQGRA